MTYPSNSFFPAFDEAERIRARKEDPDTSHKAADLAEEINALRARQILSVMIDASMRGYGLTSYEIADKVGVPRDSISSQIHKLVRAGYLWDTLNRRRHPRTNQECIIFRLTDRFIASPDFEVLLFDGKFKDQIKQQKIKYFGWVLAHARKQLLEAADD